LGVAIKYLVGVHSCLEDLDTQHGEYPIAGKFEVYKDPRGELRFRLKASNGQNILASEGYKAKASALNGIESVKKNAPEAAAVDLTTG
jgi:uncharacterized protein YegP (UPF0339 family)